MKKVFILRLAMASFAWAEIKIEMSVRIEWFPNEIFDFDKIKGCSKYGYPSCLQVCLHQDFQDMKEPQGACLLLRLPYLLLSALLPAQGDLP